MKVVKAEITNFRGVVTRNEAGEELAFRSLEFEPNFNVIIGINGIGKTSLLYALSTLLSRVLPRITPAQLGFRRFVPNDFRSQDRELTGRIWLQFDNLELVYSLIETTTHARKPKEDIDKALLRSIAERNNINDSQSRVGVPIALLFTTDRADYRRPTTEREMRMPIRRAAAYHGALTGKTVNYRTIAVWLRTRYALAEESQQERRLIEVIERALHLFLPAFGDLEIEGSPPRLYIHKGRFRLSLDQLSHGERSFLAMVIDTATRLAQANPDAVDPLAEGEGVVLIDELELHLHPKWQRTSVEHLRKTFPKLQFIATTHSPFVVQSLRPGELINLDPVSYEEQFVEYSDKSIEDISEAVMSVPIPQKSQRYLSMMEVAEKYYEVLSRAAHADEPQLQELKRELDELSIPFSEDPAFTAFLKFQRMSVLREDEANR